MIQKIKISNNTNTPVGHYVAKLPALANGKEYTFTNRVNVIVGENGCGKTTLLNMLRAYLAVYQDECGKGEYNSVLHKVYDWVNEKLHDGADVYADYRLNTFSTFAAEDRDPNVALESFKRFGEHYELSTMSKGQKTTYALITLFEMMFSKDAKLTFDYKSTFGDCQPYMDYIDKHRVLESDNTWTILMDEPDNSVDMEKIMELYGILSKPKDKVQIITVLHNPFLIAKLSQIKSVNMIEMSEGYIDKIRNQIKEFTAM